MGHRPICTINILILSHMSPWYNANGHTNSAKLDYTKTVDNKA